MPDYTQNYNLEKPAENEFYDVGVQNGNMDKLDTAIAAIDTAKADAKSTITDGDSVSIVDSTDSSKTKRVLWSTIKSALGQLFVPLTRKVNGKALSADVTLTGDDIKTSGTDETTVSSQLSNAVPRNGDVIRNGLTGATLGGGCASIAGNEDGAYLEWYESLDTYNQVRSQLRLNPPGDYGPSALLTQTTDGQQWETHALVTATPPQEQNLVLSPGWSVADNSMSTFYKTQESIVHVILNAITNSPVAEGDTIATLPVTYRPNKLFRVPIIYKLVGSGTLAVGHLDVEAYGAIRIYNCTTSAGIAEMDVNPFSFPVAN